MDEIRFTVSLADDLEKEFMAEGYRELAAETLKEVEDAFRAQAEAVLS